MCLAVVALGAHPIFSLVVAANRDEFHARPAAPARWGDDPPFAGILAGRDLMAGGTWLGVRRDARWALLTNIREGGAFDPDAPSRGHLVLAALDDSRTIDGRLCASGADGPSYNGFNLLAGGAGHALWVSNRAQHPRTLHNGVHGLSNALLDTPWPKLTRAKESLAAWAARGEESLLPLLDALADRTPAPDHALPSTGIPLEWERLLSAPFIVSERYGTRCSTILALGRSGRAQFIERSFDAGGAAAGEVRFEFDVENG